VLFRSGPVAEITLEPPLPSLPVESEPFTIVGLEFEETPPGQFSAQQKTALRKIRTELEALLTLLR
jgi:hypothetical protein